MGFLYSLILHCIFVGRIKLRRGKTCLIFTSKLHKRIDYQKTIKRICRSLMAIGALNCFVFILMGFRIKTDLKLFAVFFFRKKIMYGTYRYMIISNIDVQFASINSIH